MATLLSRSMCLPAIRAASSRRAPHLKLQHVARLTVSSTTTKVDLNSSPPPTSTNGPTAGGSKPVSAVLHRSLKSAPPEVVSANGHYITFSDGHSILDTTCGAGVACIGYNNKRVRDAMIEQIDKFSYCNSMFFGHPIGEKLATELIHGTGGVMSKAYIMSSGE